MPGSIPGNGGTLHVVGMGNNRIGMDCSFEDRSGRRKLGRALPPQPR